MPFILFGLAVFLFVYLELSLLIWLGSAIGVLGLILLLLLSSMVGVGLIRTRGWYAGISISQQLKRGELPTQSLLKSGLWIAAGILFVIPGLLTDILAIFLLLPITSLWIEKLVRHKFQFFSIKSTQQSRTFQQGESEVFEAEFERQEDRKNLP